MKVDSCHIKDSYPPAAAAGSSAADLVLMTGVACVAGGGGGLQEGLQEAARPRRPGHRLGGERLPEPHPAEGE